MAGIPDVPDDARRIVPSVHATLGPKFAVLAVVERGPAIDIPAGGNVPPVPVADRTPTELTAGDAVVGRPATVAVIPPLPGGGR